MSLVESSDETGNPSAIVTPKGIVNVWNTFFPDSNWVRVASVPGHRYKAMWFASPITNMFCCCFPLSLSASFSNATTQDENRSPDKVGTQTVNISVVCVLDSEINLDENAKKQWAVDSHRWIDVEEALKDGAYDKYVRLNVLQAQQLGLLL